MMTPHPLDRPAFAALWSDWASFAQTQGNARRLHPHYGPFAASKDPMQLDELVPLARAHGPVWIVEDHLPDQLPKGLRLEKQAEVIQMVAADLIAPSLPDDMADLPDRDGPEMRALAVMTEPGPFAEKTHLLGRFVGVRRNGQIIAIAGERMRLPGFTEVSGVCTHPDARGQGLAAALTYEIARGIHATGAVPFLHCYPENRPAVAAYERIGFTTRRRLSAFILSAVSPRARI
ncbi:MAG: GNAT family N-acetyltransferase [Chakrabartia sp.]